MRLAAVKCVESIPSVLKAARGEARSEWSSSISSELQRPENSRWLRTRHRLGFVIFDDFISDDARIYRIEAIRVTMSPASGIVEDIPLSGCCSSVIFM
jgi:hypothetical protein